MLTPEELNEIEARADGSCDAVRLVAEVRRLAALVRLAQDIEDARLESVIAQEVASRKCVAVSEAQASFRKALSDYTGEAIVKDESEQRTERLRSLLQKDQSLKARGLGSNGTNGA